MEYGDLLNLINASEIYSEMYKIPNKYIQKCKKFLIKFMKQKYTSIINGPMEI
jgi:hypothetical protein